MTDIHRVNYIRYLVSELEDLIDRKDCNFFYDNSYNNLVYSEYKVKHYLKWYWTPRVVFIPFQFKGEEVFIITKDVIERRLV